eukprot:6180693-Pleurochrysis_carterae.AAC.2
MCVRTRHSLCYHLHFSSNSAWSRVLVCGPLHELNALTGARMRARARVGMITRAVARAHGRVHAPEFAPARV